MKTIIKRINLCNYPDRFCFWLLSLVLLLYSTASLADLTPFSCSQVTDIPQSECEALVAFYQQTDGEHWLNHSGWLSDTTAANWYGVTVTDNQITELTLDDNHLVGTLSPELCQLSQLQVLNLGYDHPDATNQLSGEIPACLGQLSQLKRLSLANNVLSGSIPDTLCQLTNLQYLDLSANEQINGSIPNCLGTNLSPLRSLNLQQLSLSGAIPTSLCQLTSLQALRLQSNQLNDAIPPCLGQLNQLVILWLYHNQLSGTIPTELCQLTALEYLGLGRNQLSGTIPACLGENLSKLQILYLSYNQLTGSMPATLGQLMALRQLYLDNNKLSTPIPNELVQMVLSNLNLIQFHFHRNNLGLNECQTVQKWVARGGWIENLPGWFDGGLVHSPQINSFYFDKNCPPAFPLLTITKKGDGSGKVTGEGIDCGDDCTENHPLNTQVTLTAIAEAGFEFTVWGGDCSGTEPTITFSMDAHKNCLAHFNQPASFICTDVAPNECEALVALYQQTGGESWTNKNGWLTEMSASKWYGITVTNGHVTQINLKNNQLVGELPTEICQLSQLQQLNLGEYRSGNQLIGEIPTCLGELSELQLLTLASNEFSGEIPPQLGQLSQLITLDLRDNPLEGTLPETLCELTRLENLVVLYV
jgi:Leucine-rich repeat (LRR) protein